MRRLEDFLDDSGESDGWRLAASLDAFEAELSPTAQYVFRQARIGLYERSGSIEEDLLTLWNRFEQMLGMQ